MRTTMPTSNSRTRNSRCMQQATALAAQEACIGGRRLAAGTPQESLPEEAEARRNGSSWQAEQQRSSTNSSSFHLADKQALRAAPGRSWATTARAAAPTHSNSICSPLLLVQAGIITMSLLPAPACSSTVERWPSEASQEKEQQQDRQQQSNRPHRHLVLLPHALLRVQPPVTREEVRAAASAAAVQQLACSSSSAIWRLLASAIAAPREATTDISNTGNRLLQHTPRLPHSSSNRRQAQQD